jgi:hypothetical protein
VLILKSFSAILCMLYTYKPSFCINLSIKKTASKSVGYLSVHRNDGVSKHTDSGKRLCFILCYENNLSRLVSTIDLVLIDQQSMGNRSLHLMDTVNAKKR